MNNLVQNSIIQNIQLSDARKKELYRNCVSGKQPSKLRFVLPKQMIAASIVLLLVGSGISVNAAIMNWRERLKAMPDEVREEYVEIVNTKEEGRSYTRAMTKDEHDRMVKLLEEYHQGRYPEKDLPIYDTVNELPKGVVGYVKEMGIVCLPEEVLTDEQLLEMLDYEEKTLYSIVGVADTEEPVLSYDESLTEDDAERIREISVEAVKKYFDYDAGDAVECLVYPIPGHIEGEYENEFLVNIFSDELGTDVANVILDQATGEPTCVSLGGWGTYYENRTAEEMEAYMDSYIESAEKFLHKFFENCGVSKAIHYRMMNIEGENSAETLILLFEMEQGYYMVEVSAYDSSVASFVKFKSRAGYDDQLATTECNYKKVK